MERSALEDAEFSAYVNTVRGATDSFCRHVAWIHGQLLAERRQLERDKREHMQQVAKLEEDRRVFEAMERALLESLEPSATPAGALLECSAGSGAGEQCRNWGVLFLGYLVELRASHTLRFLHVFSNASSFKLVVDNDDVPHSVHPNPRGGFSKLELHFPLLLPAGAHRIVLQGADGMFLHTPEPAKGCKGVSYRDGSLFTSINLKLQLGLTAVSK